MKKLIAIIMILSSFSVFAEIAFIGNGSDVNENKAKANALQSLAEQFKVAVESKISNTSTMYNGNFNSTGNAVTKAETSLILLGVKYDVKKIGNSFMAKAYIETGDAPLYQTKINELFTSMNKDFNYAKNLTNKDDKIKIYINLINDFKAYEGYRFIVQGLGITNTQDLPFTYSELEQLITSIEREKQEKFTLYISNISGQGSDIASQTIRTGIIELEKFTVINNDNGNYRLEGNTTYNVSTYKAEYNKEGKLIRHPSCTATATVTITVYDKKTGKIIYSTLSTATGSDSSSERYSYSTEKAINYAINSASSEIAGKINKAFLIEGRIYKFTNKNDVVIDRGSDFGVKAGMDFEIFDKSDKEKSKKIATMKITDVSGTTAKGRIFSETRKDLPIEDGFAVKESIVDTAMQGAIIKKDKYKVTVNVGSKLKVKDGEIFEVRNPNTETLFDPVTGEPMEMDGKLEGAIIITNVYENYSLGKILQGPIDVKVGYVAKENYKAFKESKIKIGFGTIPFAVSENKKVTFSNGEVGYIGEGITGGATTESEKIGSYTRISYDYLMPKYNTNASIGVKIGETGADELSYFAIDFGADYYFTIIPGLLSVYPGVNVGIGSVNQGKISYDNIKYNSYGGYYTGTKLNDAGDISGMSLEFTAKLGANIRLKRISISPEIYYTNFSVNKWSYDTSAEGEDASSTDAATSSLRYPKLKGSGVGASLTIGYEFNGISRILNRKKK